MQEETGSVNLKALHTAMNESRRRKHEMFPFVEQMLKQYGDTVPVKVVKKEGVSVPYHGDDSRVRRPCESQRCFCCFPNGAVLPIIDEFVLFDNNPGVPTGAVCACGG